MDEKKNIKADLKKSKDSNRYENKTEASKKSMQRFSNQYLKNKVKDGELRRLNFFLDSKTSEAFDRVLAHLNEHHQLTTNIDLMRFLLKNFCQENNIFEEIEVKSKT